MLDRLLVHTDKRNSYTVQSIELAQKTKGNTEKHDRRDENSCYL